jgi:hypothetical protein
VSRVHAIGPIRGPTPRLTGVSQSFSVSKSHVGIDDLTGLSDLSGTRDLVPNNVATALSTEY